jgi:uncharacterized membrane protein YphA (DoxX/SURF4 family)
MQRYALPGAKALLTLAFLAAGVSKLLGVEMMVGTFDAIGWGQWFRYVTGLIEVGGAILLWVPGVRALAAFGLTATMIGAVIAHLVILGPSAVPAVILGLLSAFVLWSHRDELARLQPA